VKAAHRTELNESRTRRPLKSRQSRWAAACARALARAGVSPNVISVGSIVAAGIAAVCLWAATYFHSRWSQAILYFAAAAGIQLRLLCNLLDGLVAVEHAKATRSGEIYNDLPDRLSDMLILIMAGYSAAALGIRFAHELGWIAASLAVLTAYARVLGRSIGSGIYFIGPMAKQHRMALMTSGCILAALAAIAGLPAVIPGWILGTALLVIAIGCVLTILRRLRRIAADLEHRP